MELEVHDSGRPIAQFKVINQPGNTGDAYLYAKFTEGDTSMGLQMGTGDDTKLVRYGTLLKCEIARWKGSLVRVVTEADNIEQRSDLRANGGWDGRTGPSSI